LILVNEKNWMGTDNKQWHSRDKDRWLNKRCREKG
jgi:hypothetical protein